MWNVRYCHYLQINALAVQFAFMYVGSKIQRFNVIVDICGIIEGAESTIGNLWAELNWKEGLVYGDVWGK